MTIEKSHEYRGDLRDTALPEMLHTIYQNQLPGVVRVERPDGRQREVYLRNGAVVYATSTDLEDSLGAYLLRQSQITQEQYERTVNLRKGASKRYGELLVESGMLSPEDLYESLRGQIEEIVWGLFSWDEGHVVFHLGEFPDAEIIEIHLPMRQVIVRGIKRAPNARALVARLGRKDTLFRPTFRTEELIEIAIGREEYRLLRLVDANRSLYDLCTEGPFPPSENARMLYCFAVLGLIERIEGPELG